jgi:hypothetical protein
MEVIDSGYVCMDCVMMIANGEVDPETSPAREAEVAEATAGWVLGGSDENEEAHFSWSPCDCCGCRLGGDRMFASQLG